MNRKFRNMDKLKEYLTTLEGRVEGKSVSENFLKRSFQILEYYFVISLIIGTITGAIFAVLYLMFSATILVTFLGGVRREPPPTVYPYYNPCRALVAPACIPTPNDN